MKQHGAAVVSARKNEFRQVFIVDVVNHQTVKISFVLKFYNGIADAMAEQWTVHIKQLEQAA